MSTKTTQVSPTLTVVEVDQDKGTVTFSRKADPSSFAIPKADMEAFAAPSMRSIDEWRVPYPRPGRSGRLPTVSVGEMCIRGMHIEVHRELDGGCQISLTTEVRDVRDPRNFIPIHGRTRIDGQALVYGRDVLKREIRRTVLNMLEHEMDEWLRVDGELVNEPHPEVKQHETLRRPRPPDGR